MWFFFSSQNNCMFIVLISYHLHTYASTDIICVVVVTGWFLWIDNREHFFFGNLFASSQWRWQLRYCLIINNIDCIHLWTFFFDNVNQHHKYSKQLHFLCVKQKRPTSHIYFSLLSSSLRFTSQQKKNVVLLATLGNWVEFLFGLVSSEGAETASI